MTKRVIEWDNVWRDYQRLRSLSKTASLHGMKLRQLAKDLNRRYGDEYTKLAAENMAVRDEAGRDEAGRYVPSDQPTHRRRHVRTTMLPRGTVVGAMVREGWTRKEIAQAHGGKHDAQYLLQPVPEYQERQRRREEQWQAMLALHQQGGTVAEIARAFGVSFSGLIQKFQRRGIKPNSSRKGYKGSGSPRAVFDEAKAGRLLDEGYSIWKTAQLVGTTHASLARWIKRKPPALG